MAQIFISYKRFDKDIVFPIKDKIEAFIGKNTCWIDVKGIESDAQFAEVIMKNIDACSVFLFMYSKLHSQIVNYTEDWTVREINYALKRKKRIVFVNIDNSPLEGWLDFMFPQKQETNAHSPEEMARLCNNLKTWLSSSPTQPSKNNPYSVRFSVDETCELYVDGDKKRKIKGGNQPIVDGFEIGKKYHFSFHSLARANSVIEVECTQNSLMMPNQVFDMQISFAAQRQKEEEEKKAKQQAAKIEKEKEREREGIASQVLQGYDAYSPLINGFYLVGKDGLWGYVNEMGFEIIPCIYDEASLFKNDHATVCQNGKWGIIDQYGQTIVDLQSDCPCWPSENYNYFVCGREGRYAISTFDAGIPSVFPYLEVALIENHEDNYWVREEKGWRMISMIHQTPPFTMLVKDIKTGYYYFDFEFDYFESYHDEAKIKMCRLPMRVQSAMNGRWGFLNSQMKLTIPFVDESEHVSTYVGEQEIIRTNNKTGVADVEKGVFVIPCIYDAIKHVDFDGYTEPFYHIANSILPYDGRFTFYGGKQGIVDIQGNAIVPMIFQYIMYVGDKNDDLYQFACLQAPDMKLKSNGYIQDMSLDEATVHLYDLKGNLVKKIPYLSNQNTYFRWGFKDIDEIQKFAEEGNAEAQYELGICYLYDYWRYSKIEKDISKAIKWFKAAAEQGHIRAQFQLGEIYYYGKDGIRKDFNEAVKWFKLAAKQGHQDAKKYLQKHYIDY